MGILDRLMGRSTPPTILTPRVTSTGSWQEWLETISTDLGSASPAKLYRTQPHLRTIVSFRSRNIAHLGLHVFERVSETDRQRDRSSVAARALAGVDGVMTTHELIYALVGDLDLYDRAHWLVVPSADLPSGWMIRRLPPSWVTPERRTAFEVQSWRVTYGDQSVEVPADQILSFTGYSPTDPRCGSSTVEALRGTLQEQVEAAAYRAQVWKNGGRVSAVLERPAGAPQWSDPARESFREDWYAKFTGRGSKAGGTPILEDGMTLKRIDFNAKEQQFVEAAKLSLTTVAAAYHVNPTMVGQNEGANYSNVREFRKALYTDTLGPIVSQIEARINAFLLPKLGVDPERHYVEFNIDEKLQGNFEEQATALQAATGAPWMSRNEARAMRNLPAIEGGDVLVTPLNVLLGGQASPVDGQTAGGGGGTLGRPAEEIQRLIIAATALIRAGFDPEASLRAVGLDPVEHLGLLPVTVQNPDKGALPASKARAPRSFEEQHERTLEAFFSRQEKAVRSRLGAKADQWWDSERWDSELAADLLTLAAAASTWSGRKALQDAGLDPDDYDVQRTLAYLTEVAKGDAHAINETTRERITKALADDDRDAALDSTFEQNRTSRLAQIAMTLVTAASGFGAVEAARQKSAQATKTWVVNSGNPRSSHARLNGQTVPVEGTFSNGLKWPCSSGPAAEVAGCQCSVTITIPEPQEGDR